MPKPKSVEYVIVQPLDRVTNDAIQDALVDRLKNLMLDGYVIVAAAGSLDGSIHYVLTK